MRADGQTDILNFVNEFKLFFSMQVNGSHLLMLYVGRRTGQTSDDPNVRMHAHRDALGLKNKALDRNQ
jgi:hypothetical protein